MCTGLQKIKINVHSYFNNKGLHLAFLLKSSRINIFDSPQYNTVPRVSGFLVFILKIEKLGENLTKIENVSIGQWPRLVRMMKKTGWRKYCWTVPLKVTIFIKACALRKKASLWWKCKQFGGFLPWRKNKKSSKQLPRQFGLYWQRMKNNR